MARKPLHSRILNRITGFAAGLVRSRPDFIIIGAAKSGTTSLFQYLAQHPQINAPAEKELAYFAWNHQRGLNWYLSHFPYRWNSDERLTFEATPYYLHGENVASRIHQFRPDIKLMCILRDPVERAYSHWRFYNDSTFIRTRNAEDLEKLKDDRTFAEAVKQELDGYLPTRYHAYLARGYYAEQLREYQRVFGADQLLVIDFDRFKSGLPHELSRVCRFLGIEDIYADHEVVDEEKGFVTSPDADDAAGNEKQVLVRFNVNAGKPELDDDLAMELKQHFLEKNAGLNELTGIEFSWNREEIRNG